MSSLDGLVFVRILLAFLHSHLPLIPDATHHFNRPVRNIHQLAIPIRLFGGGEIRLRVTIAAVTEVVGPCSQERLEITTLERAEFRPDDYMNMIVRTLRVELIE